MRPPKKEERYLRVSKRACYYILHYYDILHTLRVHKLYKRSGNGKHTQMTMIPQYFLDNYEALHTLFATEIEDTCASGNFSDFSALCKLSGLRMLYLEDICNPWMSKGSILCANLILTCKYSHFLKRRHFESFKKERDAALRLHILCYKFWIRMVIRAKRHKNMI